MFSLFKRVPTLTRINDSIYEIEKNLLTNQHNLDHFQALVNSNLAALKRLKAMRDSSAGIDVSIKPVIEKVEPVLKAKPKLQSAA